MDSAPQNRHVYSKSKLKTTFNHPLLLLHTSTPLGSCCPQLPAALRPRSAMLLPRDSNGDAAAARAPLLASYRVPQPDPLLDKPRRSEWLGFWRGGPASEVDWGSVRATCREWVKHPMNIALLLWLLCVGASGGMLALLLLGLLDRAFPAPAARAHWVEVNNQVLNALFTLMSLYQHPALFHHAFLLCRWRLPGDAAELRAAYCGKQGGGPPRRGERAHMAVVVALLHLTVVCQYALCWLYWGFTERSRPELAEDGFFALGVGAPVAAVVYTVCSPLGKDPCGDLAACSDAASLRQQCPTKAAHAVAVVEPEWAGGMFDCGGGAAAGCCLSLSCTFCVFGWNAERLGFGNACVHATTFALLCFAPLWVLGVTALHVHDVAVGDVLGSAGVLLCAGGLLYGGYWRIQMRRKFRLPGSAACCGSKSATDYARWLFCWPCALAQEVRTASRYHIEDESFFHRKAVAAATNDEPVLTAPHRIAIAASDHEGSSKSDGHLVVVVHDEMVPPAVVQVAVAGDDGTCEQCNVVRVEKKMEAIDVVEEDGSSLLASNGEMVDHGLSGGRWRVEKVRRMINVVTMVSLLVLLYTRGFIL
ncbi:uncharacterized protein LOC125531462 [Triticum urartu]|uniref:Uncharacterized protein n=1 Tax=Triticum urartu TaxID=4572 RepID=A0A8R7VFU4_TRIUA|nr:uncharacterized protein LOC125508684 [Triticum urartu]XP_048551809.1 uncharacterized protein LOC125531462 [Triticum urartu]